MDVKSRKAAEDAAVLSTPTFRKRLGISSLPSSDVSIIETVRDICYPSYQIQEGQIIEIIIGSNSTHYTDLSKTKLFIRCRLLQKDNTPLPASSPTAPDSLMLSTIFSNVECYINNTQVSTTNNSSYPFQAFFHSVLTSTEADQNTLLRMAGYFPSDYETRISSENSAYSNGLLLAKQPFIDLFGSICLPIFEQDKLLPPETQIRVKLIPSSNQFALLGLASSSTAPFTDKIVIQEAFIETHRVLLNSKVQSVLTQQFNRIGRHDFYLNERTVIPYTIESGRRSYISETLLYALPKMAIVAIQDTSAINGDSSKSPFFFKDHDVKSIDLLFNGQPIIKNNISINISNKDYIRGYENLYRVIKSLSGECNLSFEAYEKYGYFLYPVFFDESISKPDALQSVRTGPVKLSIEFNSPTSKNLTVLFFYTFDRILSIDKDNNVSLT